MKKILFSLILILSLVLVCSCNSQNNAPVGDETTAEVSNNVTLESTQAETHIDTSQIETTETEEKTQTESAEETTETVEDTQTESVEETTETVEDTQTESVEETTETVEDTQTETVEETTENETSAIRENVVYVSYLPSNFSGNDAKVMAVPEGFMLVDRVSTTSNDIVLENIKYEFYGEVYNLKFTKSNIKKFSDAFDGKEDLEYYIYQGENTFFAFVKGTDKLLEARIRDKEEADPSKKEITVEAAEIIAMDFLKTYSLAKTLVDFEVTCRNRNTFVFYYQMNICGYKILGEKYIVGLNKNGDIYTYEDATTGLYDKFIGKVTEADIAKAEKNLYPYRLPGAYGYYEPYLKVGNDGNLYLCSSYLVDEIIDGDEITREYMFYSRVCYEE